MIEYHLKYLARLVSSNTYILLPKRLSGIIFTRSWRTKGQIETPNPFAGSQMVGDTKYMI